MNDHNSQEIQKSRDARVIVALDYANAKQAMEFVRQVDPGLCRLKVGKELFTVAGPAFVEQLVKLGFDVFLDLKFHDIPNTVANACSAAANLGVWMMNVHAMGGRRMMEAARDALDSHAAGRRPLLIAVTILTSLEQQDLEEVGLSGSPQNNVSRLAALANQARLDGVVCSPREVEMLNHQEGGDFMLVTPGIRPSDAAVGDQKRVMTPVDAITAGSHYLVIGRPITQAQHPLMVLEGIDKQIRSILT
jgi:orotidine-5'-phosphate decarboxylase